MNCGDFQGRLLAGEDSSELQAHLRSCASCREVAPTLAAGSELLRGEALWLEPGTDLEQRIIDMLVSDGAAGSDEAIPVREAPLPPTLRAVGDPVPTGPLIRRRPNVWALLTVAAVAVVALVVVANVRGEPDWEVEVAAGPAAPEASAIASGWNTPAGTRIRLDMSNLGPAPEGFLYELWLSEGPIHISGGTFSDTTDVELFVGVARRDYPRIWVTLEPIDENESPSTEVVLDTGS